MLKKREFERYQRQIAIPKLGREGQRRLKEAKVFVAGAGGLGSAASLYLAAAGIGKIRIIDKHRVKLNNLNRQILYSTRDIGRLKVEAAKKNL